MQHSNIYIAIFCFTLIISPIYFNYIYAEVDTETINNSNITKIKDIPPFYVATIEECSSSNQIKSDPHIVHQISCIEEATISNIGQVTNNFTFINTMVDDEIIFGQGYGTIFNIDGERIDWTSYDTSFTSNTSPEYRGIIYFNSTSDEKFAFLNNTIGIYISDPDTKRVMWLIE